MLLVSVAVILPASAGAQTLARRGWAGSGLNMAPWWQTAVFYQVDPDATQDSPIAGKSAFAGLADRLDYFKSLSVDSLVLTPFRLAPPQVQMTQQNSPVDHDAQADADFDSLMAEAGRRHLRILVDLHVTEQSSATTLALARFWMGRGVAGLRVGLTRQQATADNLSPAELVRLVKDLRVLCATYSGDRVLLWDSDEPFAALQQAAVEETNSARPESRLVHPGRAAGHTSRRVRSAVYRRQIVRGSDGTQLKSVAPQLEVDHALEHLPSLNASELRATLLSESPQDVSLASLPVAVTDSDAGPRSFSRYRAAQTLAVQVPDDAQTTEDATARAKVLAAALLTGRFLPMIYSGQESGMEQPNAGKDVESSNPLQSAHTSQTATSAETASAAPQTRTQLVAAEDANPDSLLNFYRRVSGLRHANSALQNGSFQLLNTVQPGVVAWVRVAHGGNSKQAAVVVVCNLSEKAETVNIEAALRSARIVANPGSTLTTLAASGIANLAVSASEPAAAIALARYGVLIGQLRSTAGVRDSISVHRRTGRRRR